MYGNGTISISAHNTSGVSKSRFNHKSSAARAATAKKIVPRPIMMW